MITKLNNFYLIDNKLLYISDKLVGFDPLLSTALIFEKPKLTGTEFNQITFQFNKDRFTAKLTFFCERGPVRGEEKIEIFKNDQPFFTYIKGSKGYGYTYGTHINYIIDNNYAYLLASGYWLQNRKTDFIFSNLNPVAYYFMRFDVFSIPKVSQSLDLQIEYDNINNKTFALNEIEKYRTEIWNAKLSTTNYEIAISESEIIGFQKEGYFGTNLLPRRVAERIAAERRAGREKYIPRKHFPNKVHPKTNIIVNGNSYNFDKY